MTLLNFFPLKTIRVERADGATLTLSDGSHVLDMGGASHGAAIVGHSHPEVVRAVQEQASKAMHIAHLFPHNSRDEFLAQLHGLVPPQLDRTFIANSGAEAVEAALKFAAAATGRHKFVAAKNSFHGRTLGALSVTHKPAYREPISAMTAPCDFVTLNDIDELAATVTNETAAIILEPVQGEGGVVPATTEFLQAARDIADEHGALLIFDEVQTGMGRTGHFLLGPSLGVVPDIACMGKGLAGGVPIGLTITSSKLAEQLPPGFHGSTYGGSPLQCAAGAAALRVWQDEHLASRSQLEGDYIMAGLRAISSPAIRDVRGIGLMINIDLKIRPGPVLQHLQDAGFLALTGGARGIRILPPLTITREQSDAFLAALAQCLVPQ